MIFDQANCWRRADACEGLLEMIADPSPDRLGVQLLRSLGHLPAINGDGGSRAGYVPVAAGRRYRTRGRARRARGAPQPCALVTASVGNLQLPVRPDPGRSAHASGEGLLRASR